MVGIEVVRRYKEVEAISMVFIHLIIYLYSYISLEW